MILIAESGSTKTDWVVSDGIVTSHLKTPGINPQIGLVERVTRELSSWINGVAEANAIDEIYYYGAGIMHGEKAEQLKSLFISMFPNAKVELQSDIVAAAKATCGDSPGIVAILGTGSNSCFWNGQESTMHTPALGYVLGDEGGGAYIGRRLLSDYFKGVMPKPAAEAFAATYGITEEEVVRRVYTEPYPNRYMASYVRFIADNRTLPGMQELTEECFAEFIKRNLHSYPVGKYPVNFVGSISVAFRTWLENACRKYSVTVGKVIASPIEELAKYHIMKKYGI